MIFDSHTHYDDQAFAEDREEILSSLFGAGVCRLVNVGASYDSTQTSLALAKQYDFIYAAAGIHPSDVEDYSQGKASLAWLEDCANQPKTVAIGEIGLDYHWDTPERDVQKTWFEAQLDLARRIKKPVIIHSRDAAKDTLEIIRASGGADLSMVIHCFSYEVEMAREYLHMGYYLGIGGVVTYKNARKLKDVVSYMPLERMLLETDCPYLTPTPHRGKRNDSSYLVHVIEEIARIKGITPQEVERATWKNAHDFYRLSEGEENGRVS